MISGITAQEMDKKDEEMRDVISRLWPVPAKKLLDLLVPTKDGKLCHTYFQLKVQRAYYCCLLNAIFCIL